MIRPEGDGAARNRAGDSPRTIDSRSLIGGCLVVALGIVAIQEGRRYAVGTLLRMGPGYFPILLGTLLAALGVGLIVLGVVKRADRRREEMLWRPVVMIPVAIAGFALALPRLGLAPATFLLVILSHISETRLAWKVAILLASGMTLLVWIVFSIVLGLPYSLFVW